MSEFVFSVIFCSLSSIVLYLVGLLILNGNRKERLFREIYGYLHVYIVFLPILLAISTGILLYVKASPGTVFLPIQTKYMGNLVEILFLIWIVGAFVRMLFFVRRSMIVRKTKGNCYEAEKEVQDRAKYLADRMGIKWSPKVYTTEFLTTAELGGWVRPCIYLADEKFSQARLDSVLIHELCHYKFGDGVIRKLCVALMIVFWFNPLLQILLYNIDKWDEKHCDYQVCMTNLISENDYGAAVIYYSEKAYKAKIANMSRPQVKSVKRKQLLEERVKFITECKKMKKANSVIAIAISVGMVCLGIGTSVVAAATLDKINDWDLNRSNLGYEEQLDDGELVEYEMAGEFMESEMETLGEVEIQASPSGMISTTLNNDTWRSGAFSAKNGQTISVAISSSVPTSVTINAGIIEPDGTWRWVNGSGNFSHAFSLDQTGTYQVFIRNKTTTSVTVFGTYATYNAE